MKRYTLLTAFIALAVQSCSVKEDRSGCPCWLEIDLAGCSRTTDMVILKGWSEAGPLFGVHIGSEDFDKWHEEEVPRGRVSYCAIGGIDAVPGTGMSVIIPEGRQSDRLYAYRSEVDAYGESAYDRVTLHKQYAAIAVRIDDVRTDYGVAVRGSWNGMSLSDLKPLKGTFLYRPEVTEEKVWYFRVPRQGDDSLVMEITAPGGYTYPYDLGKEIRDAGYDWNAEDLDDIYIGVDFTTNSLDITVIEWADGLVYDEII